MRAAHAAHLGRRFLGSLRPGGPSPADEAWVDATLTDGEMGLWRGMSGADRRHAVAVARRVVEDLGSQGATRPVLAAALLHDVGKVVSGLGTAGRVVATLAGMAGAGPLTTRSRQYLEHDRLGAELLEQAGSHPLTTAWAREHHLAAERWSLPLGTARALKAADDD